MSVRAVIPAELRGYLDDWLMSPGLVHNGVVYLTGMATMPNGSISSDPAEQIREAFPKIGLVLGEAGPTLSDILEMTSYDTGLREHIDLFRSIRAEFAEEPYPAWTAIETSGFASEGVIVEIRVIAKLS